LLVTTSTLFPKVQFQNAKYAQIHKSYYIQYTAKHHLNLFMSSIPTYAGLKPGTTDVLN